MAIMLPAAGVMAGFHSNVFATQGRITFIGSIINEPCATNFDKGDARVDCGGGQSRTLNFASTRLISFNENRTQATVKWLNHTHKLGILMVNYR